MTTEFDADHLVESLLAEGDLFSSLQSLETFEGGPVERAVRVSSAEARLEEHGTLATYGPRPINGRRRTKAEIDVIKDAMVTVVTADHPMTVRQVLYRLVSFGVVDKTEAEYKGTVGRLLTDLRRAEVVPFGWIADNTRWMRKPTTYSSVEDALRSTAQLYRRRLWDTQDAYVEVWLEKDALAGVLYEVTERWDVPLMVTRGYPSLSFVHEAADAIGELDKPIFLYYFGDHDPSGLDIPRSVEEGIREFAPWADLHFERVAVTPEQIVEWQLPTRPTKRTDTRSKGFIGESVEVDAIPPEELRRLVDDSIAQHIDAHQLHVLEVAEAEERGLLEKLADKGSKG
jgi:hypothetical protein